MGAYTKENVKYGPLKVTINGTQVGFQKAKGIVRRVPRIHLIEDDRGAIIDVWDENEYLVAEIHFLEMTESTLSLFLPTATMTGNLAEYKDTDMGKPISRVGTVIVESEYCDYYAVLVDALCFPDEQTIVGDDEKGVWSMKVTLYSAFRNGTIFKIGAKTDTTGPSVSSIDPADGETGVAVDKTIEITFDEDIMEGTVNTDNFLLIKESDETQVTVVVSYDSATKKVSMDPSSNLANGEDYMVVVLKNVCDMSGNKMAANFYSGFTTVA